MGTIWFGNSNRKKGNRLNSVTDRHLSTFLYLNSFFFFAKLNWFFRYHFNFMWILSGFNESIWLDKKKTKAMMTKKHLMIHTKYFKSKIFGAIECLWQHFFFPWRNLPFAVNAKLINKLLSGLYRVIPWLRVHVFFTSLTKHSNQLNLYFWINYDLAVIRFSGYCRSRPKNTSESWRNVIERHRTRSYARLLE